MRKWVFTLGTDARIRECVNALTDPRVRPQCEHPFSHFLCCYRHITNFQLNDYRDDVKRLRTHDVGNNGRNGQEWLLTIACVT